MRKVTLFIAMSLDGFIADGQGGVDWLVGQDPDVETADSYSLFVKDIDTVVMGYTTYNQIVTELSPDEWVYGDMESYVITHRDLPPQERITFTHQPPEELIRALRDKPGKGIWINGGARVIASLVRSDLIDEYYISVIPVLLGEGVRLFEPPFASVPLRLVRSSADNGIVELVYSRR